MKRFLCVLVGFVFSYPGLAQQYWQQKVNYTIDVALNEKDKSLDAFEKLQYQNNSPDTLRFIWFHLWPNAYKNDRTAFSEQLLLIGNTKFYFANPSQRGYINQLAFRVNNTPAKTEDHPLYIDVVKLLLPEALAPGQTVVITTPFHVKLPYNFSRGGYDGATFQLTQWYPKPAVYDAQGWHPMPYLDQGEFYSEFGSFDVRITAPKNYIIAATGELQNKDSTEQKNTATNTWHYIQNQVHDFAWFANKDFIVDRDTCLLPSGKTIHVFCYYTPPQKAIWQNSVRYAKDALRFYAAQVGDYPYATLSVVQGPKSFGGGMEYPTITVISPPQTGKELDVTMAHEIGHNWFYGMLATNERDHPWMDEGINTFYEKKYTVQKYGRQTQEEELLFQALVKQKRDQPIETTSDKFSEENYALVAYYKTAKWMQLLEEKCGTEKFRLMMHQYFNDWKFKHPQPDDFKKEMEKFLPADADQLYGLLRQTGLLPNQVLKGSKMITPFQPASIINYLKQPAKATFIAWPAVGYNAYDKLMVGGLFSNYSLPPSALQFVALPLYSTGAKRANGLGRIGYAVYPAKAVSKIEASITASTFSNNELTDDRNRKHLAQFTKLAPGLTFLFKEKDPRSKRLYYVQWKSFFIKEQPFRISFDSTFTPTDTLIVQHTYKEKLSFTIHQIRLGIRDFRALYPFSGNLVLQGSKDFLRLTFDGNYFFNYAEGGLALRVFAGKFFYDKNQSHTYGYYKERFFLNMTGANGEEDFIYNHYFIGRNKFEGLGSQQIAIRDGGFKIRTDLLANKIGKTDKWLAAMNLNTSVPAALNPLSILPVKIPLHLFLDVGTYADAWKEGSTTSRFLFDAGIHIPIFEVINIYLPLVYSRPYTDYVKSVYTKNKLFKTATFSIDLNQLTKEFKKQFLF